MSNGRDRTVSHRPDGQWANKRNNADKASSLHPTQAQAYSAARQMIANQGGGDITVQGRGGGFVERNTIAPAKDPFPPCG